MIKDPITLEMESVVDYVMNQLGPLAYPKTEAAIRNSIAYHLKTGWTAQETLMFHKYCEEVCGDLYSEDYACGRMRDISIAVNERIAAQKMVV